LTVAGTPATDAFELEREMTKPPAGAGPEIVAVPVTNVEELPCTVDGDTDSVEIVGGLTWSVAV
jgi:hypothetical protein